MKSSNCDDMIKCIQLEKQIFQAYKNKTLCLMNLIIILVLRKLFYHNQHPQKQYDQRNIQYVIYNPEKFYFSGYLIFLLN